MGLCKLIVSMLQQCIFKVRMSIMATILRDFYDMYLALPVVRLLKFLLGPLCSTKTSVGLFTREGKSQYRWLIDKLQSQTRCTVSVQPFQISNTNRWEFQEAVMKCQFAILYHSQTRGRLNITDVADSLYNEELDTLFKNLGKEKVMVVIDHMEKSKDDDKALILRNQPSIANKAQEVFLFSNEETMPHGTKVLHDTGEKKLQTVLELIAEGILCDYCAHRGPFTKGLREFVNQLCRHPVAFIQLSLCWCSVQILLLIVERKVLVRTILD